MNQLIISIHYFSGVTLAIFIGVHLFNHLLVLHSEAKHLSFMKKARRFYRNPIAEFILLVAVAVQVVSGITLVIDKWDESFVLFEWLHILSGLYLSFFLVAHVTAVMVGRHRLKMDTNLYYGAGVVNMYPHQLFFIPYYALGVLSFFVHMASVHRVKMQDYVALSQAEQQAWIIIGIGVVYAVVVLWKMTHLSISKK